MMDEPVPPTPRRTNDPEGLRRRVLDVAAASFQARGYHATSMHDIMREAGATGGALYHHFPTKKAVGLAVIRDRVAAQVAGTWIAPVQAAADALDGIAAVFAAIADGLDRRGAVAGCPVNNLALELSLADPDFQRALQAVFAGWQAAIADRLRQDQRSGRLGPADADDLAAFVVGTYSGAMALAKAGQNAGPLKACARQLMAVLAPLRVAAASASARG